MKDLSIVYILKNEISVEKQRNLSFIASDITWKQ